MENLIKTSCKGDIWVESLLKWETESCVIREGSTTGKTNSKSKGLELHALLGLEEYEGASSWVGVIKRESSSR